MHVEFFAFRDMSNHSSSCSEIFSNCWRDVTDGAISKISIIIIIIKGIYIAQVRKGHKCAILPTNKEQQTGHLYSDTHLYSLLADRVPIRPRYFTQFSYAA